MDEIRIREHFWLSGVRLPYVENASPGGHPSLFFFEKSTAVSFFFPPQSKATAASIKFNTNSQSNHHGAAYSDCVQAPRRLGSLGSNDDAGFATNCRRWWTVRFFR